MTLRIERNLRDGITILKLVGQISSSDLEHLAAQLTGGDTRMVLDLDELTLVDAAVVRFFGANEVNGVELLNCAPYIREWIRREKERE